MSSNGQDRYVQGGSGRGRRGRARHARERIGTPLRRAVPAKRRIRCESGLNQDYHSRRGAEVLSRRIEAYWRSLGFNVRTWLVPFESGAEEMPPANPEQANAGDALWSVRSSLANGLPPGPSNPFHGTEDRSIVRFRGSAIDRSTGQHLAGAAPVQPSPSPF